jgi:acetylxylan esterase
MYPGYTGEYPRMLIYHGLGDTTLSGNNYAETIKQWTGVFGYAEEPESTTPDSPIAGYTWETYGPRLAGAWSPTEGHNLPRFTDADLAWFGFV